MVALVLMTAFVLVERGHRPRWFVWPSSSTGL
jgi:hypothetical protein